MAKEKTKYVIYLISRQQLSAHSADGVLDMLRYDQSKVLNNAPSGYWAFVATTPNALNVERWQSFGITVDHVTSDFPELFTACWHAEAWVKEHGRVHPAYREVPR